MENAQKKATNSWIFWIYRKSSPSWNRIRIEVPNVIDAEEAIKLISCLHCPQKFKHQQGLSIRIKRKHAR